MQVKEIQIQRLRVILNSDYGIGMDERYAQYKLHMLVGEASNIRPMEIMEIVNVTFATLMSKRYKIAYMIFGFTPFTEKLWQFLNDKRFTPDAIAIAEAALEPDDVKAIEVKEPGPLPGNNAATSNLIQKIAHLQLVIDDLASENQVLVRHIELLNSQVKQQLTMFKAEFTRRAELDFTYYRIKARVRQLEDILACVKKHGAANVDLLALEGITGDVVLTESETSSVYSDYGSSVGEWSCDEDSDSGSIKNYGV